MSILLCIYLHKKFRQEHLFEHYGINRYSFRPDLLKLGTVKMNYSKYREHGSIIISNNRYSSYDISMFSAQGRLKHQICGVQRRDIASRVKQLMMYL